jgi:hypothetical protein
MVFRPHGPSLFCEKQRSWPGGPRPGPPFRRRGEEQVFRVSLLNIGIVARLRGSHAGTLFASFGTPRWQRRTRRWRAGSLPSDGQIKNIRFAQGNCAAHYPVSVEIGWAFRVACREADDYLAPVRHSMRLGLGFGAGAGRKEHLMARLLQKDDLVVYAAFLPALLASGAIGATAVLAGALFRLPALSA